MKAFSSLHALHTAVVRLVIVVYSKQPYILTFQLLTQSIYQLCPSCLLAGIEKHSVSFNGFNVRLGQDNFIHRPNIYTSYSKSFEFS